MARISDCRSLGCYCYLSSRTYEEVEHSKIVVHVSEDYYVNLRACFKHNLDCAYCDLLDYND